MNGKNKKNYSEIIQWICIDDCGETMGNGQEHIQQLCINRIKYKAYLKYLCNLNIVLYKMCLKYNDETNPAKKNMEALDAEQ